jgi:hypothetical protein
MNSNAKVMTQMGQNILNKTQQPCMPQTPLTIREILSKLTRGHEVQRSEP